MTSATISVGLPVIRISLTFMTLPAFSNRQPCSANDVLLGDNHEIVEDKTQLFEDLKRVQVDNHCRPAGWKIAPPVNICRP